MTQLLAQSHKACERHRLDLNPDLTDFISCSHQPTETTPYIPHSTIKICFCFSVEVDLQPCIRNAGPRLWAVNPVVRINLQKPILCPYSSWGHWQTPLRLHPFVPNPCIHNFKYIFLRDLGPWFLPWQNCRSGCLLELSTLVKTFQFCATQYSCH